MNNVTKITVVAVTMLIITMFGVTIGQGVSDVAEAQQVRHESIDEAVQHILRG